MKRVIMAGLLAVGLMVAVVGVAGATESPVDDHKITICHATASLSNPYVEITIDLSAWNDPTDPKHHGDHHTRTKRGVTWSDYVLEEGQECSLNPPSDPPDNS